MDIEAKSYTPVAKWLHWLMAAVIVAAWGVGYYAHEFTVRGTPERAEMFGVHKAIGTLVLLLVLLRIVWRATHPAPALPGDMNPLVQRAARLVHFAFYVLMLAQPLSGWAMSSAKGREVYFVGLWELPALVAKNPELGEILEGAHKFMAWTLLVLVAGHLTMALYHHFVRKDGVLRRMLPGN